MKRAVADYNNNIQATLASVDALSEVRQDLRFEVAVPAAGIGAAIQQLCQATTKDPLEPDLEWAVETQDLCNHYSAILWYGQLVA